MANLQKVSCLENSFCTTLVSFWLCEVVLKLSVYIAEVFFGPQKYNFQNILSVHLLIYFYVRILKKRGGVLPLVQIMTQTIFDVKFWLYLTIVEMLWASTCHILTFWELWASWAVKIFLWVKWNLSKLLTWDSFQNFWMWPLFPSSLKRADDIQTLFAEKH